MNLQEYAQYDALGLAKLVRDGEISAKELVELAERAIAQVNPALNFQVAPISSEQRGKMNPDGPFAGVPLMIKDLGVYLAGVPSEYGSRLAKGVKFDHDTELAARYRQSGVVFVGRTCTPELGISAHTISLASGITRNPWNSLFSPGGSSGGSAAAVAARAVPFAHAADGMGSIRIPAHCCGLFGLKPSRGRLPKGPGWGGVGDLSSSHVLTRSVRDSAAMLDATSGIESGASIWLPLPHTSFLQDASSEPPPLRIGVISKLPFGNGAEPDCQQALQQCANLARELGHTVEEVELPIDWEEFTRALLVLVTSMLAYGVKKVAQATKRQLDASTLEPLTLTCVEYGEQLSVERLIATLEYVNTLNRKVARLFEKVDLLLTPICQAPALPLAELPNPAGLQADEALLQALHYIQFAPLFNVTGQPAMSLPIHWNAAGMPVGVQCAAGLGQESRLFAFAGQIERAQPWIHRYPPLAVK